VTGAAEPYAAGAVRISSKPKLSVALTGSQPRQPTLPAVKMPSRFVAGETGATAIEYGILAACVGVTIIAMMQNVGTRLNMTFLKIDSGLERQVLIERYYEELPGREPAPRVLRIRPREPDRLDAPRPGERASGR
jgi:pilus assembly protein Flp/PilA